jgi:anaerobic selenocysteine-containing dehydrogenase
MKKTILAIAAAATLAGATLTAPTAADARCYGCAVGAGVIGGLAAGAIIGSAIANSQPRGGYVVYDGYDAPPPYRCHRGYWARQRMYNRYGDFVGWSRPHFVCRERW